MLMPPGETLYAMYNRVVQSQDPGTGDENSRSMMKTNSGSADEQLLLR